MQIRVEEGNVRLFLEDDLTLTEAAGLKEGLLEALAGGDSIEVDLTKVTAMDLSALQLFCSAHRTAMASSKDLVLTGTESGVLLQARKAAGYIRHQGCVYNPTKSCLWVGGDK